MNEHGGRPAASAVDQRPADDASAPGPADPSGHVAEPSNAVMPTAENVVRSVLAASGLSPSANSSEAPRDTTRAPGRIVRATSEAADTVADAARDVKSAISGSAVKAGKKLDDKAESSLGPYGSPGTCVPSDLDPLAAAVHAGLDLEAGASESDEDAGEGRESCAGVDAQNGKERRE
ncbi:Anucleate primary sterigmata protein [Lasiodiplodia theobromae]|uniref:Anucleate primary sterigmata protein n=1 Tax=Lasiodiplodia theobromae TaxID=45133 RepID=UPI0015C32634|nr:Anucleate primary sterigmata protein [Lasiodiplodia theobromae]KAF4536248.1 Anucleate primary sterigmata protein [Lasiodiplodia theobromae]